MFILKAWHSTPMVKRRGDGDKFIHPIHLQSPGPFFLTLTVVQCYISMEVTHN